MLIKTGQTIYEMVTSLDANNNPISAATFTQYVFVDGALNTGVTISISLAEPSRGIFSASFSASSIGFHQFELINNNTNVVYMSTNYNVRPDNEVDTTIYIGI